MIDFKAMIEEDRGLSESPGVAWLVADAYKRGLEEMKARAVDACLLNTKADNCLEFCQLILDIHTEE